MGPGSLLQQLPASQGLHSPNVLSDAELHRLGVHGPSSGAEPHKASFCIPRCLLGSGRSFLSTSPKGLVLGMIQALPVWSTGLQAVQHCQVSGSCWDVDLPPTMLSAGSQVELSRKDDVSVSYDVPQASAA